jgi:hypothetical protein
MWPRNKLPLSLFVLDAVWVSACQLGRPTPIGKILENPTAFQEVVVSGVVTERVGGLGWNAYVLRDETGEIRVITNRALPRVGDRVRVSAEVKSLVALGDFQVIVLTEKDPKRPPFWGRRYKPAGGPRLAANTCQILLGQTFIFI